MDAQRRTRSCFRQRPPQAAGTPRGAKQICVSMTRDTYDRIWRDPGQVRQFLGPLIRDTPEVFPEGIQRAFN